ncbi:hypothetical protein NDU88_008986 [Pleurodeles waltl]|uniref:Uncharacterized protein n=1 Tax=Pleurodeles waltl TaxID=8319 RepID=A0AAV7PRH0_PLEWA|nr:hypothetical protein NDU88_008986 [Pleurodeles waltl]
MGSPHTPDRCSVHRRKLRRSRFPATPQWPFRAAASLRFSSLSRLWHREGAVEGERRSQSPLFALSPPGLLCAPVPGSVDRAGRSRSNSCCCRSGCSKPLILAVPRAHFFRGTERP